MKERPILMSAPMVVATREDRKTMTRRIVKGSEAFDAIEAHEELPGEFAPWRDGEREPTILFPYGEPGDRLWVKENYRLDVAYDAKKPIDVNSRSAIWYEADGTVYGGGVPGKLRPSIFLRRVWSRLVLEIKDVRAERLQDISEEDSIAEGVLVEDWNGRECYGRRTPDGHGVFYDTARAAFMDLWCEINGRASWNSNPWVWVVTFERIKP